MNRIYRMSGIDEDQLPFQDCILSILLILSEREHAAPDGAGDR